MGAREWLERKKGEIEERLHVPQKRAFLEWAAGVLNADDTALTTVTGREEWYIATNQNSKIKIQKYNVEFKIDSEERRKGQGHPAQLRLVMCLPGEFENVLKGLRKEKQKEEWQKIFGTSILEIWEWREYYSRYGLPLPLRFGFSQEEKELMARFVRNETEVKLRGNPLAAAEKSDQVIFPERFRERVFLGAALWIRGELRSSVIIKDRPLDAALAQASIEVPFDPRFKPVSLEEFGQARLEITIVHQPSLPLSEQERKQDIDPTHGYRVSVSEQKRGWYFPEVFNCARFSGMPDLLTKLEQKARIPRTLLSQAKRAAFEVTDFVEAKDQSRVLDLTGPIVENRKISTGFDSQFREALENMLRKAAEHLMRVQEDDGNIPPVFDPFTGKSKQIDWVRQALTAGALVLAGQTLEKPEYEKASEKALRYLEHNFFSHPMLLAGPRTAASVYYGKTLLLLDRIEEARGIAQSLLVSGQGQGPINDLQVASFFVSLGETLPESFHEGRRRLLRILEDYDQRIRGKEDLQLAHFPEAIPVLLRLSDITGEKSFREKAEAVTRWHASQQLPDGSFPIVPGSRFAYSRGTGKLFEVFASEPAENQATLLRAFSWLENMQYDEGNTYFIPEDRLARVLGGFRHDALNPEVWTDAAAHVLIGGARLLHFLKSGNKNREF